MSLSFRVFFNHAKNRSSRLKVLAGAPGNSCACALGCWVVEGTLGEFSAPLIVTISRHCCCPPPSPSPLPPLLFWNFFAEIFHGAEFGLLATH